jgi:hypothetical protein
VALGTFFGMMPQCFLQAYLAEKLFEVVPLPAIIGGATVAAIVVIWITLRRTPETHKVSG